MDQGVWLIKEGSLYYGVLLSVLEMKLHHRSRWTTATLGSIGGTVVWSLSVQLEISTSSLMV